MAFLMGPRLLPNGRGKIVMKKYPTHVQNLKHVDEVFREILIESMRAPNVNHNELKNPYTRERNLKKLGKTTEERREARYLERERKYEIAQAFALEELTPIVEQVDERV